MFRNPRTQELGNSAANREKEEVDMYMDLRKNPVSKAPTLSL
jgi:hypothetical protein